MQFNLTEKEGKNQASRCRETLIAIADLLKCKRYLELKPGRYYIGSAEDVEARLTKHNSGKVRSTKNNRPYRLIYKEEYPTRADAYRRERQIKNYKGGEAFKKLINNSSQDAGVDNRSSL